VQRNPTLLRAFLVPNVDWTPFAKDVPTNPSKPQSINQSIKCESDSTLTHNHSLNWTYSLHSLRKEQKKERERELYLCANNPLCESHIEFIRSNNVDHSWTIKYNKSNK
jgi:hypothetical protein